MDWEVFTLEDERLKVLGQEISSDMGRRILALLRERPMSPNDLSKELEVPLTTVIFHIEKLKDAGLIRPLVRMAGRRGQKTLYTLASSAFIILPVHSEDKERIFEIIRASITIPKELIIRGAVVGLLIGVLMLFPWYFLTINYYSRQVPEAVYTTLGENVSSNATVGPMVRAKSPNETPSAVGIPRPGEPPWLPILLAFGVLASMISATTVLLLLRRSGREVMGYRVKSP